jgi:hypothetical protein
MNDKPNCQVSMILMNPRPTHVKRSENDSLIITFYEENPEKTIFIQKPHSSWNTLR